MPNYRRYRVEGATYFFTVVTHERREFLTTELARKYLRSALGTARNRAPFELIAFVLMPDHMYCLMELPPEDADYSTRWSHIKGEFSRAFLKGGGKQGSATRSRINKGEAAIWQRRFSEHVIRDEKDFGQHFDYIHYNPVKHRYVRSVAEWPWSSFHRYVREGWYDPEWGSHEPPDIDMMFERIE